MSRFAKDLRAEKKNADKVTNFMGGTSYKINPLDTLKLVAASSIFGEPSYYRPSVKERRFSYNKYIDDGIFTGFSDKTTTEIFTEVIDAALSYDFKATLEFAAELRNTYNMRLNPQVIMVRAAMHPDRKNFTKKYPSMFAAINNAVMSRADEPATQLAYYIHEYGDKNGLPSILKRSLASKLSSLSPYLVNKYKNAEIGMIDAVRITHANSPAIDALMHDTLKVKEDSQTWEQMRSAGKSWREICDTINMGHMAMLRNLRNVFTEIDDRKFADQYLQKLKDGVLRGKQFPFRYYTAYQQIEAAKDINFKSRILDTLEECMDISVDNLPKLRGTTVAFSDNSGSAWGAVTSEYGSTVVAEIDNLSAVLAVKASDDGEVVKFGDKAKVYPVSFRNGVLIQAKSINESRGLDVGLSTEGGIWERLDYMIREGVKCDNIFIYSDMQAGHAGLYGTSLQVNQYKETYAQAHGSYIDVYAMIKEYRKKVNPKVNVFMVQTAGYNNVLMPEYAYRTAILSGWTGKEIAFAAEYSKRWDEIENNQ